MQNVTQQEVKENFNANEKNAVEKFGVGRYCVIRTYSAGVFAGTLKSRNGKEAILIDVRRIWYWSGACSLSQLAAEGVKYPNDCKFSVKNSELLITEVIEVIPTTNKAQEIIEGVPEWKK